jgi:hypothetical protein
VYDVLGKKVAVLVDGMMDPGYYTVTFDATRLAGGIYFYVLQSGTGYDVKKMSVVK